MIWPELAQKTIPHTSPGQSQFSIQNVKKMQTLHGKKIHNPSTIKYERALACVCVCFYCRSEKRCQSSDFEKVLWNVYDKVATITTSVIITRKPLPLQAILCWLCLSGANQAPYIYALNNKLVVVKSLQLCQNDRSP